MMHRTEADLIHAMHEARQWFERNSRRYAPDDVQLFDRLIPLVEKPLHLHALSDEMKRRMLPETQDRAPDSPSLQSRSSRVSSVPSNPPNRPTPSGITNEIVRSLPSVGVY